MADSLWTIGVVAQDPDMTLRVQACAAQQGETGDGWAWARRWQWASTPQWAAKWDSAVANGVEAPGRDPAVITDLDILARVQQLLGVGGA